MLPRAPLAHPCVCQFAMVSKSTDCRPRRGTCRLGKNKKPIKVNVKCKYCKLFRCASHCDCSVPGTATYGMRTGREAPRKSQSVQQRVQPEQQPQRHNDTKLAAATASLSDEKPLKFHALVGRPLQTSVKVFPSAEWRKEAVADIRNAQSVVIGSYMFDAEDIQKALLAELRRRGKEFRCAVIVDEDMHSESGCKRQKPMLKTLGEAGAHIYVAHGQHSTGRMSKYRGSFHIKCMVLDSRIAFHGSCNYTEASTKNWEMVLRVTGAAASDMGAILMEVMSSDQCTIFKC